MPNLEKQIVIPTLGLYQGRAKHLVPRKDVGQNIQEIGLSYCRNVSLSRKQACIMKSKGIANFTASATGATDSVRGIGVLNKFAREEEFQSSNLSITQVDGATDDAMAYGGTDYSTSTTVLKAGSLAATSPDPVAPGQTTDDVYTDDVTFFTDTQYLSFGGKYSAGIRFPAVAVDQGATITSAKLWFYRYDQTGTLNGTVKGEDVDDSATFSNLTDFDARTRTTASVDIDTLTQETGSWYSYNIVTIVQEIVDRVGWASGQDMAILFDGTLVGGVSVGHLRIFSYDHAFPYQPYITISVGSQVAYHFGVKLDGISGVAQGATIASARLKMKLDSHGSTPTLRIYGHDADTAWRDTGTHDGGNNEATVMTDSTASWTVDALIGRTIKNVTDASSGTVTDNDATTVTVASLSGGTDDDWDTNDKYEIYEPTVRTIWDGMQSNLTTAYVDWSPATQDMGAGEWLYSPDIKNIVQEIVDRAGFDADSIAIFIKDNSSGTNTSLNVRSYDYSGNTDGPSLEVDISVAHATSPTYFLYVNGATEGEIWKLDENLTPGDVSQVAEAYANAYQNQIAKFKQFGDDLIFTDDGKSDPQIWDASAGPTLFVDLATTIKGRYWNEFKARAWLWYVVYGGTIYQSQGVYSAVNDATSWDTANDTISLPGFDAVTFALNLSQDEQIVYKEGSSHRIIDRQTPASDYQPFVISPIDGSLGANVVSDGARHYGINDKGIWQWPVQGYPGGFRYIHQPIQSEFDKLTLPKMRLVWFAHWPGRQAILMNYADTGATYNNLCAIFNYQHDRWENISDIFGSNVMDYAFDQSGNPIVLLGKEDGHLKYITGDDNGGNAFTGTIDTGAVYKYDPQNRLISRRLVSIEPDTNYDGSMTLEFFIKGYNRPDEESSANWQGPYTHTTVVPGNKEFVPVNHSLEYNYHIVRVEGALADEAYEVYSIGLNFDLGSR